MRLAHRLSEIEASATLAISAKAKEMKARGAEVISLSAGEPDFEVPGSIAEGVRTAVREGRSRYTPVPGIPELREAVARKLMRDNGLTYDPGEILITAGAKHAIYNGIMALVDPGDEVLVPAPYWVSYPAMISLAGGTMVRIPTRPEEGYRLSAEGVEAACTEKTRALVMNSPNNPTGAVYDEERLARIAEVAPKRDLFVISDEIYEKLVFGDARHQSVAAAGPGMRERTLVVNGFSKAYAMPGWRLGYGAGPKAWIDAMAKIQGHSVSNAPSLVQYAVVAALGSGDEAVEAMRRAFEKRRDFLCRGLTKIPGLSAPLPEGAFYVMADVSSVLPARLGDRSLASSSDLALALLEEGGVATVPGEAFGAPDTIRLSYAASTEELDKALGKIETFLGALERG
ncbi:MAG: pyridoxal phosphate-dependent aminotransferase [Planctomycetota bacterium]|jgi:aspartate aminotransferase